MLIIVIALLIVCVIYLWIYTSPKSNRKSNSKSSGTIVWKNDGDIIIEYRTKPPHFRNIPKDDPMDEFGSCGYCKYYNYEKGCVKYGVKGYGVGSVVQTVCDDFNTSFGEK